MKKILVLMVLGLTVLVPLSAQDRKNEMSHEEFTRYAALQIGLDATFTVTAVDEEGKSSVVECRDVCVRKERVAGVNCFAHELYVNKSRTRTTFLAADQDGIKLYRVLDGDKDTVYQTPQLFVKFPPAKGEAWEWEGVQNGKKMKVKHQNEGIENIDVPAGKFSCIKMYMERMEYSEDETWKLVSWGNVWFGKDRGLVKQDFYFMGEGGKKRHETMEMKEFKITPSDPQKKK